LLELALSLVLFFIEFTFESTMGEGQSKNGEGARFSKQELNQLKKEFKALDKDKSGELDLEEFRALFASHMKGTTPEQMKNLFDFMDTDKSKTVSFKELSTALALLSTGTNEEKLEFLFGTFDTDGSGSLTGNEITALVDQMKGIGASLGRDASKMDSFIKGLLSKLDKDGDGEITKEEWIKAGLATPSVITLLIGE